MIAVGVTTAPRKGPPVLERCVASLLSTGFERPVIFAEPGARWASWVQATADVVQRPEPFGEWVNWINGLLETLERRPNAEAVLMVEDDVVFCRRVREWLESVLWPSSGCGVIRVYTPGLNRTALRRGLSRLPDAHARKMRAACALLFPRQVAYDLVRYGAVHGWRGHPIETIADMSEKKATDSFVGVAMQELGCEVWGVNPSLVEHDAPFSTHGHGGSDSPGRHGLDFPGVEADAFSCM